MRSYQTIERLALLNSSSCRFDGVRYYDYYDFELPGAGEISFSLSSPDFPRQVVLNTMSGEYLAGNANSYYAARLTRTLPAGGYKVIAVSNASEVAGSYTLTIETGQLAAPPPPPPETTTDADQDEERVLPPDNTEVAEVVRGYVLARVHPLPENDRRGAYRIEFGFLSEEVLASGSDRAAVVEANAHLLPPRRYLNEASMLDRARDNNRNWLHSSPIDVLPLEGDDTTLSGEPLLTGRVIARWNPTAGGRFRIEFGFLPEAAIEAAGDDTQRAAEACADLLPDPGRYLSESRINSEARRSAPRWLTSSLVEIGGDGDCTVNGNGPVTITPIAVPLTLPRSEAISEESIAIIRGDLGATFTPVTVTGLPEGLKWDLAETSADGREHQLTVSGTISSSAAARDYIVQITAEGANGERTTETIRIIVGPPPNGIKITWGGYTPATTSVGGSVRIVQPRVTSPVPPPPSVTWEFTTRTTNICTVHRTTGALTLLAVGVCQVQVTASATGYGADEDDAQVTVVPGDVRITWSGYTRNSVEFGDATPTLVRPTATVNGESPPPGFRFLYSEAPDSATVCSVNEVTGALTIDAAGTCTINLTNLPGPGYGVGSASASVQVQPGDPGLRWRGYSPAMVQSRDSTPRLLQPTAVAPTIRFSYSSLTPSVCSINSDTGALTLVAEDGACIVQVSTSGDPNYRAASETTTVTIEGVEAPVVSISCSPTEAEINAQVTCRYRLVSGDEPDEWDWQVSRGAVPLSSGDSETFTIVIISAGTHTVSLEASNDGGSGRDSTMLEGPQPPQVRVQCPSSAEENERIECTYTRTDGDRATRWSWSDSDGGSGSSRSYSVRFSSPGTKTVYLVAGNGGGDGRRGQDTVTVERGVEPPEIRSISCSPSRPNVNENVTCTADVRGTEPIRYSWSGGDSRGSDRTYSTSFGSSGTRTVRLTVSNSSADSDSDDTTVTVVRTPRPVFTIGCTPSSPRANESVECRLTSDSGGNIDTYSWRASGGSPSSGSGRVYRTSFSQDGTYTVTLTASNAGGDGRDSTTVRVWTPPPPPPRVQAPVGRIDCPPAIVVRSTLTCTWHRTGGDPATSWVWSGADRGGSTSTYSERFSVLGTQTVRLTVSNAGGSASARLPVRGVAPPPSTQYGRCGTDRIRVYYFEWSTYTKRWVNMTWAEVAARVSGWGEHMIGSMSQRDCDSWPNGTNLTTSNWPPRR